jgi:hypothetical protein
MQGLGKHLSFARLCQTKCSRARADAQRRTAKARANGHDVKLFGKQAAEGQTARLRLGKAPRKQPWQTLKAKPSSTLQSNDRQRKQPLNALKFTHVQRRQMLQNHELHTRQKIPLRS